MSSSSSSNSSWPWSFSSWHHHPYILHTDDENDEGLLRNKISSFSSTSSSIFDQQPFPSPPLEDVPSWESGWDPVDAFFGMPSPSPSPSSISSSSSNASTTKAAIPSLMDPFGDASMSLQLGGNKVVVIGIIGSSRHDRFAVANRCVSRPLFADTTSDPPTTRPGCCLEVHHDTNHNIIFVNLKSILDMESLSTAISELEQNINRSDFHLWLEKKEYSHMKSLLFLFYVCHVILIVQKGNTFDLQYLRLFRLLQNIKQIITASSLLHQTEAKYVGFTPGRQPPIVGFIFRISRFRGQPPSSSSSTSSKDVPLQTTAQFKKQLRQSLDVQIRLILRKSCGRALQLSGSKGPARETQGTSLFILDAKRAVFVDDELPTGGDEIEDKESATSTISSTTNNEESTPIPSSSSASTTQPASRRPYSFHFNDSGENGTEEKAISSGSGTSSLRRYILALARGVTHQAGSHGRPELPNSKNWFDSSIGLFRIFFLRKSQRGRSDIVEKLKSFLDPEYKFSTSRCVQAIPVAKETYLRDIPSKYNSSVHELHLQKALKEFNQMARGPAVEYYLTRLKEDLLKVWKGRQLCDSESLTGRPCIFEVHRAPREEGPGGTDETEFERGANNTNSSLPVFNHSSGIRSLLACNCGRSRKIQEDPFDLDVANFYSFNVEGCCNLLTSFELQETASSSCFVGGKEHISHFHHTHSHTHTHSKTQSLPTSIPSNRVNRKSSWALHRLGPSSTYSTETGLSQEGFLPGCNFLSSVELPCYLQSQERPGPPPSIAEANLIVLLRNARKPLSAPHLDTFASGNKPTNKQTRSRRDRQQQLLQPSSQKSKAPVPSSPSRTSGALRSIQIGFEYECSSGHRFFLSLDGGVQNVSKASLVALVQAAVASEFSLFVVCPCTSQKVSKGQQLAQLQRVFLVTPDTSTLASINPRIQFFKTTSPFSGVDGFKCIFDLGTPVILPKNSFLCLRLPRIFTFNGKPLIQTGVTSPYQATMQLDLSFFPSLGGEPRAL